MFCPGCGEPISKHHTECPGCSADLTLARRRVTKTPWLKRTQPQRLLAAKCEAARLKLPMRTAVETEEQFIERVNEATTKSLEDLDKSMTLRGIGVRA
jgi:hypothetical protein